MLPIRWMAKVDSSQRRLMCGRMVLSCGRYSHSVTEDFNNQEVIDNAIVGPERKLLSQPPSCPDEVYHVMQRCWVDDTEERASFEELHGLLAQIHAYA